jgi:hypothetical protein
MDQSIRHPEIEGWGADLNPKNRPAVPKEKSPKGGTGAHWLVPPAQVSTVRVFHSIERPGLTPVYGTTLPPRGLSGVIRGFAYRYSEGRWTHWLTLLFADRVNEVEGIFDDLRRGLVPNVFAEMGWKAKWKYNRTGFFRTLGSTGLITLALAGSSVAFFRMRGRRRVSRSERSPRSAASYRKRSRNLRRGVARSEIVALAAPGSVNLVAPRGKKGISARRRSAERGQKPFLA